MLGAVLGVDLLELGVFVGEVLHARGHFHRVRTGRAGLFLGSVVVAVFVVIFIDRVFVHGDRAGSGQCSGGSVGFFNQVVEADHDLGQTLLAFLVRFVIGQQHFGRQREHAQCCLDLAQTFFDALGDGDFAFAGQQLNRAHFAHIHAHRVGGATTFGVQRGQRGGGFFGSGVVNLAVAGVAIVEQQGFSIGGNFMDIDAHAVDHADDVFDLLRVDQVVGQVVIDFGVGQIALFQALADQ